MAITAPPNCAVRNRDENRAQNTWRTPESGVSLSQFYWRTRTIHQNAGVSRRKLAIIWNKAAIDEIHFDHSGIGGHDCDVAGIRSLSAMLVVPMGDLISDEQDASQSIFIPTTKAVAAYRICVSLRANSSRNSPRSRRSNVGGPTLRLACGIDGRDMGPPCVTLPLKKAGTCVDVRTEGTIVLVRTAGAAGGRAEGVACPIEQRVSLPGRADV